MVTGQEVPEEGMRRQLAVSIKAIGGLITGKAGGFSCSAFYFAGQ
jgi:hypothetical protein